MLFHIIAFWATTYLVISTPCWLYKLCLHHKGMALKVLHLPLNFVWPRASILACTCMQTY